MNTRLFDVLHDAADYCLLAVADQIDVDFDSRIKEKVEQHWALVRHFYRVVHIAL